jgi:diguanylate cyclase (GGDEF)-like protein
VTASFGVATLPGSADDMRELVAAADEALYRAKRAGKNRTVRAEASPQL